MSSSLQREKGARHAHLPRPEAPAGNSRAARRLPGCRAERGALPAGPVRQDPRPPACSSASRGPRSVAGSRDRTFLEGELLLPGTQTLTPAPPPQGLLPNSRESRLGPVIPGHLPFPALVSELPWVFWANRREASLCACGGGRGAVEAPSWV